MTSRRPDVLQYPTGYTVLHIFQAVLSVIVLIVLVLTVHIVPFAGNCLMLFATSATLAVSIWLVLAQLSMTHLYNFWAALVLDILLVIVWIASVALLATQTAFLWVTSSDYCDSHDCARLCNGEKCANALSDAGRFYGYVFATSVGLGGLQFLLVVVSLFFHGIMTCRYRRYNRIGVNLESEPIQSYPKHVQSSTEYRPVDS